MSGLAGEAFARMRGEDRRGGDPLVDLDGVAAAEGDVRDAPSSGEVGRTRLWAQTGQSGDRGREVLISERSPVQRSKEMQRERRMRWGCPSEEFEGLGGPGGRRLD